MPFPFIAPLKGWVRTKLENREKSSYETYRLSPFVIISSGAIVTNDTSKGINEIIKNGPSGGKTFKGCVISNQSEFSKLYQTSETTLGYDLDGNSITIEGEVGRKISTPIIQSVEIDTDGGNNTLKTAQIKVKCFSLKQLEMFDLFFLRPSMHVMLEYGWNADIIKRNTDIDSKLFSKNKHDEYVKKFSKIVTDVRTSKSEYLDTLKTTDGNYDYMAGKVTNFSYSPAEDGTYDIDLQLSAGNELQLWMPIKQSNTKSNVPKLPNPSESNPYNSWVRKIVADFNQPAILKQLSNQSVWKNEFFNWGVINDRDETKVVSFNEYISFKLILELLKTQELFKSNDTITLNYIDSQKNEVIPMNSDKYMISSSDDIIIPNEMPEFKFSEKKKNVLIIDDAPRKVKQPYKGINKKIFNLNDNNLTAVIPGSNSPLISGNDVKYGNLLNIFFKYNTILQIYNESFTQADFINGVLSIVNDNTYGLCKMELMAFDDASDSTGKLLQIMDYKLLQSPPIDEKSVYRFKIGPTNSVVREFNFSMELSTLAEAQALYQSQLNLNNILDKDAFVTGANGELGLKDDRYSLFDMSYAKNSDGYFSINEIEKRSVITTAKTRNAKRETDKLDIIVSKSSNDDSNSEGDKSIDNLEEVLKSKSIKFKISDKEIKTLIFLDRGVILNKLKKAEKNASALTFFEISLAIDGIAGLSCGEYFKIDGIPEIYNKNGIFQITNVKQGIDESGWKTTIEAGYRINTNTI
jgi:hypothetical protein